MEGRGGPKFFVDSKKGEVAELKNLLRKLQWDRDLKKRIEAIKKVVAFMTLGINMSGLFSEMVMCGSSDNLVLKKMVHLYLSTYACSNSELAILAVNTLQKDFKDENPIVRGMALRCLCSLGLTDMIDYLDEGVRTGLKDSSGYVRKIAVIGVIKLYHLKKEMVQDLIPLLYNLISDMDTQVCTCAIYSLNEILIDSEGIEVTKTIAIELLNRITLFNEWGQICILNLVSSYVPTNSEEMYDIMNILEHRLKSSSTSVVLGCIKCFLNLTKRDDELKKQVFERLRPPLLTLASTNSSEMSYTILVHIKFILVNCYDLLHQIFTNDYKQFFCKYNDPSYLKKLKLDILILISSDSTAEFIIREIAEYVYDIDNDIAQTAIYAISSIGMKYTSTTLEDIMSVLLSFLQLDRLCITIATLVTLKDLSRTKEFCDNGYFSVIFQTMKQMSYFRNVDLTDVGEAALLYLLGEFGTEADETPYIIEDLLVVKSSQYERTAISNPESTTRPLAQLNGLTACIKLFGKRPLEMKPILIEVLKQSLDSTHPEIHDQGLLYYRLLNLSVHTASILVGSKKRYIHQFPSETIYPTGDKPSMDEFNTLSIVYGKPSSLFVKKKPIPFYGNFSDTPSPQLSPHLLESDAPDHKHITLKMASPLKPSSFEEAWEDIHVSGDLTFVYPSGEPLISVLETKLSIGFISTMASGVVEQPGAKMSRLYVYGEDLDLRSYLAQVEVEWQSRTGRIYAKCYHGERSALQFAYLIREAIKF